VMEKHFNLFSLSKFPADIFYFGANIHKLATTLIGAFYFAVGIISPKYRSQISAIHRSRQVFKPIVADVKMLVRIK